MDVFGRDDAEWILRHLRALLLRALRTAVESITLVKPGHGGSRSTIPSSLARLPMSPLVSAIVPVYNGERFLSEAIDSALAQTYGSVEIIVVDDGSTDSSGALADSYAQLHPDVVRVVHQANAGLVAARNAAIASARGEYLATLDCDDIWLPGHLDESVALLEREPEIGLVHADILRFDSSGIRAREKQRWLVDDDGFKSLLLRHEHISMPTAVFRRSLVERVGTFDHAFNRLGCEDRDLWLRMARVSKLRYIDSVHAYYRLHEDSMSKNKERMFRARCLLVERHARGTYRGLRRRAMASIHDEQGYDYHQSGLRRNAVKSYARALIWRPQMASAWKGIARCISRSSPT